MEYRDIQLSRNGQLDMLFDGAQHVFLASGGVMVDLNSLISRLAGWTLERAEAINDVGPNHRLWRDRRRDPCLLTYCGARAVDPFLAIPFCDLLPRTSRRRRALSGASRGSVRLICRLTRDISRLVAIQERLLRLERLGCQLGGFLAPSLPL